MSSGHESPYEYLFRGLGWQEPAIAPPKTCRHIERGEATVQQKRKKSIAVCVLLSSLFASALASGSGVVAAAPSPPKTGFEKSNGAEWTTHEQELSFLAEVDRRSGRVRMGVIGRTASRRPLHLVRIGQPAPMNTARATRSKTILFVCSQHGNEPAGREACLQLLRDLAFTKSSALINQMKNTALLFVPAANPDGRADNTRENTAGIDINRDHLNLVSPEARAIAKVVKEWRPDVVLDLHEYGPSIPALYDDELLYLWPRNLNVDKKVHDLSETLARKYIGESAREAGFSSDEYGMYAVADQDIHQSAGDGDEGILRNAMGLRHALGILVESAVSSNPTNGPDEVTDESAVNRRRVASQLFVSLQTLRFLRERGGEVNGATAGARRRKAAEGASRGAPVYFGGADNQEPESSDVVDPPPCSYTLTSTQLASVRDVLSLLGVTAKKTSKGALVRMGQVAEPLIPLVLDERGLRHSVEGRPQASCG